MSTRLSLCFALAGCVAAAAEFPPPATDIPAAATKQKATAVLAGGCFWGVEAVFERLKGVSDVVSGYAGGSRITAEYEVVSSGITGHAESVKITLRSVADFLWPLTAGLLRGRARSHDVESARP